MFSHPPTQASRWPAALLLCLAWATPAWATQPSIIVRKLAIDTVVASDGTAVTTTHREQTPTSRAAAAALGQFPIPFNPALEQLEITEAYTRKPDGARIAIDVAAVRTQLAPGVPNVPIFQDVQQKIVVFPALEPDDTAVITYVTRIRHPLFAGAFMWQTEFSRGVAWDDVDIAVTAPETLPLQTESFGLAEQRDAPDGQIRHRWHYHAMDVPAEDLAAISSWDRLPRLFVSSFPDYAALATAYARLAAPKAVVTPAIQARADAITQGVTDRREQARLLYDWVSTHIRYVALYLAAGGVEPHAASSVLLNGYGDCKDHVVLFEALLRARGIDSRAVLVNLDTAYTLSAPPTLAQLDHVITYIPELDLFADTTSGVAPFGTLPFQEAGKPAVLIGDAPHVLLQLPRLTADLDAPDAATFATRTEAHVDLDGAIIGTTRIEAQGPAAIALRLTARWVQTAGQERAARRQLVALGQMGTGVFTLPTNDSLAPTTRVTGSFRLDPQPEILEGGSFAMPLGLQLLVRPGDYLLGPLNQPTLPASEPTPCFPGRQTEELSLELPEGRHPLRLPPERLIETPAFTYRSRWSMAGQVVTVRRELDSHVTTPLCSGPLRRDVVAAMAEIRRDQRTRLVLATP